MRRTPRAAILTGVRGAGKTTLCIDLARSSHGYAGIASPPLAGPDSEKIGFKALCLQTGESWELARSDVALDGPRVGKYSFSAEGIARALECIKRSLGGEGRTIVDEIGPLELNRGMGYSAVLPLLAGAGDLLLVVRTELVEPLAEYVPRHAREVFTLTAASRSALRSGIQEFLES